MTNPIRPEEVIRLSKSTGVPEIVIEIFNKQIQEMYSAGQADVSVLQVISELGERKFDTGKLHSKHWFGIVDLYRKEGWIVEYDWPDHREPHPTRFIFIYVEK